MLGRIVSRLRLAFHRSRFESDMDAEVRDHIAKYVDDLIARGVAPLEARRRARGEFGAIDSIKDACRESKGLAWPDSLVRTLRHSFRILRKSPAFSLTVILTLAMCIGANTAIFSVVDAILFRPLPYPEHSRLGQIATYFQSQRGTTEFATVDGKQWEYLRTHIRSLDLALYSTAQGANLSGESRGEYIQQMRVSAGFFSVLGVNPAMGREIELEEDRAGGPAVAVLSHGLWQRVFKSRSEAIGGKIVLRGEPYTVIGIMPEGFNTMPPVDVWTPIRPSLSGEGGGSNYSLVARVRPGYSWDQAKAEISAAGPSYISALKIKVSPGTALGFSLVTIQRAAAMNGRMPIERPLLVLWAAAGLILLIGCVNIAGLMLARAGTRRHEIATRLALGSGRRAILGQLFAESSLLAAAGGLAGLVFGYGLLVLVRTMLQQSLELKQVMTIDLRVLAMTALTALTATILFGLYPSWDSTRVDIRTGLAASGRSTRRSSWSRRGIVVFEIALGMVLLVSAGLMLQTLSYFSGLKAGFDGSNVMTANLSLQDARYTSAATVNRLFDETLARLSEYPGVSAAGVGLTMPYEPALNLGIPVLDGPEAGKENQIVNVTYVTPGYFHALRMELTAGRFFDDRDNATAQPAAIVNEAFVRRFLDNDTPVGRHLSVNKKSQIVGVIADIPHAGYTRPLDYVSHVYLPAAQQTDAFFQLVHTWFPPTWVVRSASTPAEVGAALSGALAPVDPQLPIARFRTMDQIRAQSFSLPKLESILLGTLGGLALLITAIGVYGLIANSVSERKREFGIRIALGASTSSAIKVAVRPGIVLAATGIGIGYILARWTSSLLRTLVYGVQLTDGATYIAVGAVLLLAAALASLIPSLRIAGIDPAGTLREE